MTQALVEKILYSTKDPEALLANCPAMTTMLYTVCDSNDFKFGEAMRLVELFVKEALKQ